MVHSDGDPPAGHRPKGLLGGYKPIPGTFDEAFQSDGTIRAAVQAVIDRIDGLPHLEFKKRKELAEETFLRDGLTFAVYSAVAAGVGRVCPFGLIARIIAARDWARLDGGLRQRIEALEAVLADVYGEGRCLSEGVITREIVEASSGYLPEVRGIEPAGGVRVHVAGIDIIQDPDGHFLILEDNLRTPSGVSYVMENRAIMKRTFPKIFEEAHVRPVNDYPMRLVEALSSLAPQGKDSPRVVILTPGSYNSAYFEHSFLARRTGCELVEGRDLFVANDRVWVKTTMGAQPVDVIYRRIDDAFLDPEVFRKDSILGVPGIMAAYAKGNVTLANGVGNGVADDKAVYPYVPDLIRFFLDEEPLLGQVETFICARPEECGHVLANLDKLVVKAVDEAGGYGMLIGPQASKKEIADFAARIAKHPRKYIAQPRIELSTSPTWTGESTAPRRVDLRPYVVSGRTRWVLPGGLSRVALREGSYVVNSSQGGGSKDTWVLDGMETGA
jgi:uncharacterized circularly permuted ATP-grasp superfamily protein